MFLESLHVTNTSKLVAHEKKEVTLLLSEPQIMRTWIVRVVLCAPFIEKLPARQDLSQHSCFLGGG